MACCGWPSAREREQCCDAWAKASVEERRELSALTCDASVLYLRVTEAMLAARGAARAGDEAASRAALRLEALEWRMEHPRSLRLPASFCEAADGMRFMLAHCAPSHEACLDVLMHARSGRIGVDLDSHVLVHPGAALTWAHHACNLFTLLVHDLLRHMNQAQARARCLASVRAALEPPPSPLRALRSWPPKKPFADLRETWASLDTQERVNLAAVSCGEYWFIQACDVATSAVTLRHFDLQHLEAGLLVLEQLRSQATLIACLEVVTLPVPRLLLKPEFVDSPSCLEALRRRAVSRASEKDALLQLALTGHYEGLFEVERLSLVAKSSTTWADVERVVATLVLEGLLQRHALLVQVDDGARKQQEAEAQRAAARREAAQRRRKDKARAKAAEAKLQRAEGARCAAEEARRAAEEARRAAEEERRAAEAERRAAEEARVHAEELRVAERAEERRRTLALLAKAPAWDLPALRVSRTFLDFEEPDAWAGPLAYAADW